MSTATATFVETLCQTPLLEAPQREELLQQLQHRYSDVRDLARELLRRDWLTPFQLNQLLLGKGGELLLGNYVLIERLGEGGMGQVYKARHRTHGRVVALKVLRNNLLTNLTAVRRFMREMSTAALLDHPNIVKALDADQAEGTYFFAMDYVEGQDLARMVKQQGPLRIARACDYIRQAALGLQHAHEQGFVHRDIKPANLLVSHPSDNPTAGSPFERWGTLMILDMGLARIVEDEDGPAVTQLTQMGVVMGTPDYIAPEQARNSSKTDIRSDLYSLGCTFYFLLTGKVPFPEGTLTEKLLHHQLDEPPPVEELRRAQQLAQGTPSGDVKYLSPKVGDIVRKLMSKKPENRFQEPKEVAEALVELLSSGAAGGNRSEARVPVIVPPPSGKIRSGTPSGKFQRPPTPTSRKLQTVPPSKQPAAEQFIAPATAPAPDATTEPTAVVHLPAPPRSPWKSRLVFAGIAAAVLVIGLVLAALVPHGEDPGLPEQPQAIIPPINPIEESWRTLQGKANDRHYPLTDLRLELVGFRLQHPASEQARKSSELLLQLRSPLDQLDSSGIPAGERFDWQVQQLVAVFGQRGDPAFPNSALAVAISPDARYVAGTHLNGQVGLWDAAAPNPRDRAWLAGPKARSLRLAFSPDGSSLVAGTIDGKLLFWDLKTRVLRTADLPRFNDKFLKLIQALAWSPDGKTVVAGCADGSLYRCLPATLEVRELERKNKQRLVQALVFSPDGTILACSRFDDSLTLYSWPIPEKDAPRPETIWAGRSATLAFSPDSQTLLAAGTMDGAIRVYSRSGQKFVEKRLLRDHKDMVVQLACSPDGKRFASVCNKNGLFVWDMIRGERLPVWLSRKGDRRDECELRWLVTGMTWAPDGRHLALSNANGTIYLFRLPEAGALPVAAAPQDKAAG